MSCNTTSILPRTPVSYFVHVLVIPESSVRLSVLASDRVEVSEFEERPALLVLTCLNCLTVKLQATKVVPLRKGGYLPPCISGSQCFLAMWTSH
jgi:hypothetical protein